MLLKRVAVGVIVATLFVLEGCREEKLVLHHDCY